MDTKHLTVAIVGAGIAGLTAATALSRAGIECQVFEQARYLREVGAGIQIAPSAARLLHRLGLADHLDAVAVQPEAIEMRRWDDNRVVARIALGSECVQQYGVPYYVTHRADLHHGLLGLLPNGMVHLGLQCVGIEEHAAGVELRFADGSTASADVVVGADGIHSMIRDGLMIDKPRFSGQTIYRGLVPAERLSFLLDEPKVLLWLGPSQHGVCYPISSGKLISFGATIPAEDWRTESWSAQGRIADVAAAYSGWNEEIRQVIDAADSTSRWALHDRDTVEHWSSARTTIIGDAAHPMLPFMAQGANQAIEDAVVLAACLRDLQQDVSAALLRYEGLRKSRTAEVHQISRANARTLHLDDGEQQQRRDSDMGGSTNLRAQEWLYGYDAELAAAR